MCVLVCSRVWLFGTPWTPPALAKVDLTSHTGTPSLLYISTPRWFPSESLQQLFSFIHFISIFTWEGCSSFVHPTHARPILSSFYSEHHLISRSFGICCFQPVGGTSRNLEQGRRKRSRYFFPIPSLLWCHVSGQWLGPSTMTAPMKQLLLHHSNSFFFFNFTYLFIWLLQVLVEACRIFPCSTQALHCGSLAPECQGLNLHPPVLESRCLTTGPPGKSLHDSNS